MERVHMIGENINITPMIYHQPEEGEESLTRVNRHRFDESESEYDEDQFANVDEDVINMQSISYDRSEKNLNQAKNYNKQPQDLRFDYADDIKQNLRGNKSKITSTYANFANDLTDK